MIRIILKPRNRVDGEPFTAAYMFPGRGRHTPEIPAQGT